MPHLTIRDISLITVLTALCVAGNYAFIEIPNIKIMDLIVFTTGFIFGIPIGTIIAVLSWVVYGTINPFGFSLPIWLSSLVGEAAFGIIGGICGRINSKNTEKINVFLFSIEMGLWGLIITLIYDLFTNIVFAFSFGIPIIVAIVTGWLIPPWFGILHEASNLILFSSAVYPLTKIIRSFRGGEKV